jgi:hypothetical protein
MRLPSESGFIPHRCAKFPSDRLTANPDCEWIPRESACAIRQAAGSFLALVLGERIVFRLAVLSIVFALAAAPEATLLCRLWCPNDASAGDCEHHPQASSISVKATDACDAAGASIVAALSREDGRRAAGGFGPGHAVSVERHQIVQLTRGTRTLEGWAREHALEKRPLETTLRL